MTDKCLCWSKQWVSLCGHFWVYFSLSCWDWNGAILGFWKAESEIQSAKHYVTIMCCESIVGCIYASNPQFKSNILQCHLFLFKSIVKQSKQLKNIFSNFLYFYWHLFSCHFYSSTMSTVRRFVFCFHLKVWFWVEEALTSTLDLPDNLVTWWSRH